jgi:DNA-binding response OmpR family regulator
MEREPYLEDSYGKMVTITRLPFVIGRSLDADMVIPSGNISREQALIRQQAKSYVIEDLDSRNGTFVNGIRLGKEACRLESGDLIVLGGEISLIFRDPNETSANPAIGRLKGVWIDDVLREVWVDRQKVEPPLTSQQYTLLALLYRSLDSIITREEVIREVWPGQSPAGISQEAVDTVIKRLRSRLRETSEERDYIEIIRGQGLRLILPE